MLKTVYMPVNNLQATPVKKETISQLAHRHMFDPNHITTDEELANAVVEFSHQPDKSASLFEIDNETLLAPLPGEPALSANADGNRVPNPYTVLGK